MSQNSNSYLNTVYSNTVNIQYTNHVVQYIYNIVNNEYNISWVVFWYYVFI